MAWQPLNQDYGMAAIKPRLWHGSQVNQDYGMAANSDYGMGANIYHGISILVRSKCKMRAEVGQGNHQLHSVHDE